MLRNLLGAVQEGARMPVASEKHGGLRPLALLQASSCKPVPALGWNLAYALPASCYDRKCTTMHPSEEHDESCKYC